MDSRSYYGRKSGMFIICMLVLILDTFFRNMLFKHNAYKETCVF